MATRNHSTDRIPGYSPESLHVIRWTGLLTTDVGDWVTVPQHSDYTVQLIADSGTTLANVIMEGSNENAAPSAKNIGVLNDSRGAGGTTQLRWVAFADANKLLQGLEAPVQMRPNFSGAGDASVTVIVVFRKAIF
jgi:hypothetical protein